MYWIIKIRWYFSKIDPKLFKYGKNIFKNNNIFILQFPNGNDLSFSCGQILSFKDNKIIHSASTEIEASGSPIIRRWKDNYIVGLHFGGYKKRFNLATFFDSILEDIKRRNISINDKSKIYFNSDNISGNKYIQSNLYMNPNQYLGIQNLNVVPYTPFYQNQNISFPEKNKYDNFVLLFTYEGKEGYIEFNGDILFEDVINKIYMKFPWVPRTGVGFLLQRGNNMSEIERDKTISQNGLKYLERIIIA